MTSTRCAHVHIVTGDSLLVCNKDGTLPDGGGPPLCEEHQRLAPVRGFVYVAEWGQFVKIGYSSNPAKRVASICRGSDATIAPPDPQPGRPVLVGFVPGDLTTEALLHAALGAHRATGEWFRRCPAVDALCAQALRTNGGTIDGFDHEYPVPPADF